MAGDHRERVGEIRRHVGHDRAQHAGQAREIDRLGSEQLAKDEHRFVRRARLGPQPPRENQRVVLENPDRGLRIADFDGEQSRRAAHRARGAFRGGSMRSAVRLNISL